MDDGIKIPHLTRANALHEDGFLVPCAFLCPRSHTAGMHHYFDSPNSDLIGTTYLYRSDRRNIPANVGERSRDTIRAPRFFIRRAPSWQYRWIA
jgi:hypothetical protein